MPLLPWHLRRRRLMSAMEIRTFYMICFLIYQTECRQLNSRTTSSNDNNCNSITIITITKRIITRTCMALSAPFLHPARSRPTRWPFRWLPTTHPCTSRIHLFSRQTASTWTCISRSAAHATACLMASTAVATIISSTEATAAMIRCSSRPANVLHSWINSRTTARFQLNSSRTRNRLCKHRHRAPTLQTATPMSPSDRHHPTAPTSKRSSKTANCWTAWIRSTTTTRIHPTSITFWSQIKKLANWHSCCRRTEKKRRQHWRCLQGFTNWLSEAGEPFLIRIFFFFCWLWIIFSSLRFMSVIFYTCKYILLRKPSDFLFLYEIYFLYIEL